MGSPRDFAPLKLSDHQFLSSYRQHGEIHLRGSCRPAGLSEERYFKVQEHVSCQGEGGHQQIQGYVRRKSCARSQHVTARQSERVRCIAPPILRHCCDCTGSIFCCDCGSKSCSLQFLILLIAAYVLRPKQSKWFACPCSIYGIAAS